MILIKRTICAYEFKELDKKIQDRVINGHLRPFSFAILKAKPAVAQKFIKKEVRYLKKFLYTKEGEYIYKGE